MLQDDKEDVYVGAFVHALFQSCFDMPVRLDQFSRWPAKAFMAKCFLNVKALACTPIFVGYLALNLSAIIPNLLSTSAL
jgi:hypothetical protein